MLPPHQQAMLVRGTKDKEHAMADAPVYGANGRLSFCSARGGRWRAIKASGSGAQAVRISELFGAFSKLLALMFDDFHDICWSISSTECGENAKSARWSERLCPPASVRAQHSKPRGWL